MLRSTTLRVSDFMHTRFHRFSAPLVAQFHSPARHTSRGALLRIGNVRSTQLSRYEQLAHFHSSSPRQGHFIAALLASVLKASASIEYVQMATRIAFTFVPLTIVDKMMTRKYLRHVVKDNPEMAERGAELQKRVKRRAAIYRVLLSIPIVIFGLTAIASLERTPLSGRWRFILLSPEEEEAISDQLQGAGWYTAVLDILSQDGPPKIIPPSDWRYQWVNDTMRHLEGIIPVLAHEADAGQPWLERAPDDAPLPPPAAYPLRPRPSAKEVLRWFCEMTRSQRKKAYHTPHSITGPPYNLILVDCPDCDNAFSFGFGPNGGGGVVVYSGFLDRILASEGACPKPQKPAPVQLRQSNSLLSSLLGSFSLGQPPTTPAPTYTPTPEQTSQLAILLSHELAHLILSHHLETLSSGSVVIPGTLSIVSDIFRALLFPFTMMFGPFVNDAVANLGRVSSFEVGKLTEYCTSVAQEFEADSVSARILAHAGFDARQTIAFWEQREDARISECSPQRAESKGRSLAFRIMGSTHPVHEARVMRLKTELARWETEKTKALRKAARSAKSEGKPARCEG